jgi:hypothetical protein
MSRDRENLEAAADYLRDYLYEIELAGDYKDRDHEDSNRYYDLMGLEDWLRNDYLRRADGATEAPQ